MHPVRSRTFSFGCSSRMQTQCAWIVCKQDRTSQLRLAAARETSPLSAIGTPLNGPSLTSGASLIFDPVMAVLLARSFRRLHEQVAALLAERSFASGLALTLL